MRDMIQVSRLASKDVERFWKVGKMVLPKFGIRIPYWEFVQYQTFGMKHTKIITD